jgi:S1-C subfamily serine protease
VEREEWENDPEYPRAPLPPHERKWRHPSELGESQWVRSEPPLVVGRGLSIATGTVGAILALGLLWLLIPHSDRGGVAAETSSPTIRPEPTGRSFAIASSSPDTSTAPTAEHVSATTSSAVEQPAPTTTALRITTTVPAIEAEPTTLAEAVPAMAVALIPGHLVVTTAAAVSGRTDLDVQLPTGDTVHASVVAVDESSGTAVLAVPVEIAAAQLAPTAQVAPTEGVVKGNSANIWTDDEGTKVSNDADVPLDESSLVLDADGGLIGMCTHGDGGTKLVGVDALLDAVNGASENEAPLWLGVRVKISAAGDITIVDVMTDGPAAAAGLVAGDVVEAIDGTSITDLTTLRKAIVNHKAGDIVKLTVVHPDATEPTDVEVTLAASPWPI